MVDILYPVRVKVLDERAKGREVQYATRLLGSTLYALPMNCEEEPIELMRNVRSHCSDFYHVVLTNDNTVFVSGVDKSLKVDDAFMVSCIGDDVMITGNESVVFWDIKTNRVFEIQYGGYITSGNLIRKDVFILIMDGDIYLNMRNVSKARRIYNERIKYHKMVDLYAFTTTTGFVYGRTHVNIGKTPKRYVMLGDTALVLVEGEIFTFKMKNGNFEFSLSSNDTYIHDIAVVGNTVYGLDKDGVFEMIME